MSNSQKFCKNCLHLIRGFLISHDTEKTARCSHPSLATGEVSLVTGLPLYTQPNLCMYMRMKTGKCGPEGSLYTDTPSYEYAVSLTTSGPPKRTSNSSTKKKDVSDFM